METNHDTSLSFKNQDFYIGIDVHKNQWTLSVLLLLKKTGKIQTMAQIDGNKNQSSLNQLPRNTSSVKHTPPQNTRTE